MGEEFEDDLVDYEDQVEEQVYNDVMNFKKIVEDDAEHLQRSQS
jgi:hypothetical protein